MRFEHIKKFANRITAVSCPVAGVQWTPPVLECNTAEKLMSFLAQKRVFYNALDDERAAACWHSVNDIRRELTTYSQTHGPKTELGKLLRGMNRDCRTFVDTMEQHRQLDRDGEYVISRSIKEQAILTLRHAFGRHIARLSLKYGVDVEDELAVLIPFAHRER
jgi:hypothetical protein